MNLNELIEQRVSIQVQIDDLNAQLKELNKQKAANEQLVFNELDQQGLTRMANTVASVSINETVKPVVKSWDSYIAYVRETGDDSLLSVALKQAPFRELQESGIDIPGIEPATFRRLNMRKL